MHAQENSDKAIAQINSIIADFDVAMLVTQSLQNELRGRPMTVAGHENGAVLYFLTRSDDEKLQELLRNRDVCVVMQDSGRYISVSGRAHLETNTQLIDKHWSAAARLWFPDGPTDTAITLVVVEPRYAEYWDRTGLNKLEFWWEAGKALLQGERAADENLRGHAKVQLSGGQQSVP